VSRTAPCKTFAGPISKTSPSGEIDTLDPGGFGALTITKAITIDGAGGGLSSVLVSGTNGIVVSAGVNDVVVLRNLQFQGIGLGLSGIRFLSGKALQIEHCRIQGFTDHGIDVNLPAGGSVSIVDTISLNNTQNGLNIIGSAARVNVTIDGSRFEHNGNFGVLAADFARVTVRNSDASDNAIGFVADAATGQATLNIASSTAGNNTTGIQAGGGASPSTVRLTGVSILSNSVNGLVIGTNGTIISFGNNYNSGNGAPSSTVAPQ
jgi:hypothetical protein